VISWIGREEGIWFSDKIYRQTLYSMVNKRIRRKQTEDFG
jgi:hypothetical protein